MHVKDQQQVPYHQIAESRFTDSCDWGVAERPRWTSLARPPRTTIEWAKRSKEIMIQDFLFVWNIHVKNLCSLCVSATLPTIQSDRWCRESVKSLNWRCCPKSTTKLSWCNIQSPVIGLRYLHMMILHLQSRCLLTQTHVEQTGAIQVIPALALSETKVDYCWRIWDNESKEQDPWSLYLDM